MTRPSPPTTPFRRSFIQSRMMGFSFDSRLLLLLLLCLHRHDCVAPVLAAPTFPQNGLATEGKLPLSPSTTVKAETVSSVSKRGGGGHGGGGHGGGGEGGGRRGGPGSMIPIYAGGAAGAGAHGHHNGAAMNRGRPNRRDNLGLAVLLALPLLFKYFA